LSSKTISIPPDALPFNNAELKDRMNTRLSLFNKKITKEWNELNEIKKEIENLRKEYLVSCNIRKGKSILKKELKSAFQAAINNFQKNANDKIENLKNKVQTAINNSEDTISEELKLFFNTNPPPSLNGLNSENRDRQLSKEINKVISKIKFPDANSLVSKMKLEVMYYEFTWEDLNDKKFIEWFVKSNLISAQDEVKLASFSKAYSIKK
jgi:phenylalanyl-tRNA synthetase alpha subunit